MLFLAFLHKIATNCNLGRSKTSGFVRNQGDRSRDSLKMSDHGPVPLIAKHNPFLYVFKHYFVFQTNTINATKRMIHSSVVVLIVTVHISIPCTY